MESKSSSTKRTLTVVVVALVLVAAVAAGAVFHYANRGRNDQLHTDEMGRQRDVTNAANAAKGKMAAAATQMSAATKPAAQ